MKKFMLTSKKKSHHTLRITISEEYKYLVKIKVFDSNSRIVESQSSDRYEVLFILPQGLYTVRIEMNGDIKDEIILLDKEKVYKIGDINSYTTNNIKTISPSKQFSSALLGETYGSSFEYYTNPAVEWSKGETFSLNINDNSNSSLFIFLRFPSVEKFEKFKSSFSKPFYSEFEIVDEFGQVLIEFGEKSGVEVNNHQGWVAFNAKLPSGIYYFLYKGNEPRQIPIYVYENWHTQFFMTLGNQPLFGTIRIFLSRNREFDPNDKLNKYIDILLDKLQNQDFSLDPELIEIAASGKFESPMLGLICSYIYLKSKETKHDYLFNIITHNMQNVILNGNQESPDLRALNILAANHLPKYKYKETNVSGTPMLRIGFETILKASVQNKELIPQNSINDFISENLYFDSPFNTFKPIPLINTSLHLGFIKYYLGTDENSFDRFDKFNLGINKMVVPDSDEDLQAMTPNFDINIERYSKRIVTLFDDKLFKHIKVMNNSGKEISWIQNSIAEIVKSNKDISINDISNNLNISGNTVNRIFTNWQNEVNK